LMVELYDTREKKNNYTYLMYIIILFLPERV